MRGQDRDALSLATRELLALERSRRETNADKRARAFARVTAATGGAVGLAAIAAKAAASANPASGAAGAGAAVGGTAGTAGTTVAGAGGASVAAKLVALGSTKIAAVVIAASVASGVGAAVLFERPAEPPMTSATSATNVVNATSAPPERAVPATPASPTSSLAVIEQPPKPAPKDPMPVRVAPTRPPEPIATALAVPAATSTSTSTPTSAVADRPTSHPLEAERRLIDAARAALVRGDTTSALASADEHERLFPRGQLVAEREVLAVRALARSGHGTEARARSRRFVQEHPNHALGEIVERAARGPDETR